MSAASEPNSPVLAEAHAPTLERHNANAGAAKPTGQWKLHTCKKETARKLSVELLSELEKRGLTLDRDTDIWSRTDGRGGNDKLTLQTDEGEEVVLDKQKLAEKLIRYDPTKACWGRFVGDDQRCGTPVGLVPEHPHAQCRTAKHYCETCLKELRVPADRVLVAARKDATDGGPYANGNQPVWSKSGARKYRSFNTCAPCAREDISIVVWADAAAVAVADAPAVDADNTAPAPMPSDRPIPAEWLRGEEGAGYVALEYIGGSRDFEPMLTWAQCDRDECNKWRLLRQGQKKPSEDDEWCCEMNEDVRSTIRTARPRSSGIHRQSLSLWHPQVNFKSCDTPEEEYPAAAAAAAAGPSSTPSRKRPAPARAETTAAHPRKSSRRVQELQRANAADLRDALKKGEEYIEALEALRNPWREISSLVSMASRQVQTGLDYIRERVEAEEEAEPEGGAMQSLSGGEEPEGVVTRSLSGGGEDCGGGGGGGGGGRARYRGLDAGEEPEGGGHAAYCSLGGGVEDCGERVSVPSQDGMLEALAESLAALAMARVPPQLQQLQDEFLELYRKVFSA